MIKELETQASEEGITEMMLVGQRRGEGCGLLNCSLGVYNMPFKGVGEQMFPNENSTRWKESTLALT